MEQKKARKWFIKCIGILITALIFIAFAVIFVDPYFHYHKPFSFLSYRLHEERYTNDGISRHFDYNAVIPGTSMTKNYNPREIEDY